MKKTNEDRNLFKSFFILLLFSARKSNTDNEKEINILKELPEKKPKKSKKNFIFIFLFAVLATAVIGSYVIYETENPELPKERTKKRDDAIDRVIRRKYKKENCEQYVLKAVYSGYYPILYRGKIIANDSIWLNNGEVWKYGKTCVGELGRYPGQIYYYDKKQLLNTDDLRYKVEFRGTEKASLIEEKKKIYNYPLLPECVKRKKQLIRPPGNKIDN